MDEEGPEILLFFYPHLFLFSWGVVCTETGINPRSVKTVLLSEITARKIEFAALLSPNGTILVNAQGKNRTGELWDPSGCESSYWW